MDKQINTIIFFFLSVILCSFSILSDAQGNDAQFYVEGEVYCDTCRAQFFTRLSEYLSGAKVRLECRNRQGGEVNYTTEGVTDETGHYRLAVTGDHAEEICEIVLVESPKPECAEIGKEGWAKAASRVSLTTDNGMINSVRRANPLGFMKKEALPECVQVYKEMGILPTNV